jgi:hypothetical protein
MVFQPGQSGNPEGRKPGSKNFTTLVREALKQVGEMKHPDTGQPIHIPYEEMLVKRVLQKALNGDQRMIELVWNYLDGKPMQKFEHGVDKESLADLTAFFRKAAKPEDKDETNG